MLEATGLAKRIGERQLFAGLTFQVEAGGLLIITGPNGAGKTTLLRLLAGVTRPSAGSIRLLGEPFDAGRPALRARIGYVAHEPLLYPHLSGRENLEHFARLYGVSDRGRLEALIADWGLAGREHEPVRAYSRGMRQRLALARALMPKPVLLLLDEPHAGLDDDGRLRLERMLAQHRQRGGAVIMTTHDPGQAERLNGRLAVLSGGRLAVGS